jgi:hypothetical protein
MQGLRACLDPWTQSLARWQIAEIGRPWEPENLAFYIVLAFFAKCVVSEKILSLGTTPVLKGDVSIWAGLVISFYFSKRSFENATRIMMR